MCRRHGSVAEVIPPWPGLRPEPRVAAAVAVWPPGRWTTPAPVFATVLGLPLLGVALCLVGDDRHRALSVLGMGLLLAGLLVSVPIFGERFVAP